MAKGQPQPAQVKAGPSFEFSGSTKPTNHTALMLASGSGKNWCKAAASANTDDFIGMYNQKFSDLERAASGRIHGSQVAPVRGCVDWVRVSGSVTLFDELEVAATGALCSTSGSARWVVAKALGAGVHGDDIRADIYERAQYRA